MLHAVFLGSVGRVSVPFVCKRSFIIRCKLVAEPLWAPNGCQYRGAGDHLGGCWWQSSRRKHWADLFWRGWGGTGADEHRFASVSWFLQIKPPQSVSVEQELMTRVSALPCWLDASALPLPAVGSVGDLFAGAWNVQGVELPIQEPFWVLGVRKNKHGREWRKPRLNSRLTITWCKIYVKSSSPIPKLTEKSVCSH